MAGKPEKRPVTGGRATPAKGAVPAPAAKAERPKSPAEKRAEAKAVGRSGSEIRKAARSGNPRKAAAAVGTSPRITPRIPRSEKESPRWLPVVMFGLLGLGMVLIFLNYIGWPFGDPSNVRLIMGLVLILGGILVATQYR